ncbi:hypothetical protein KQX64_09795 [Rhodopseudomonas palustris]|nr:hypothetical protein KQX64_09795 [Rhodopseudomonas palustris]
MADTFLLYRPDPFGVSMSRYALAQGDNLKFLSGGELYLHPNQVITFDVPTLIEDLRRNGHPPPKAMIDACDAIRLATGLSKSDGGEPKWDYWRWLRPYFAADSHWAALKAMHSSRTSDGPHLDDETLFNSFAEASRALWHDLLEKLLSLGEHERFFRVEVPAANVFHARQFKGIAIDTDYVDDALRRASQSKYDAYREVAKQINISPSGLNYWNVSRHLPLSERTFLDEAVQGYSLRDQLKMASDTSAFARAFTELMDASKDVDILTRLSGSNRTFPTFHCIGTISCRTLVSDPHLQELRRRFRGAIVSDNGNSLHYFDYSQFEPGIMASLSGILN